MCRNTSGVVLLVGESLGDLLFASLSWGKQCSGDLVFFFLPSPGGKCFWGGLFFILDTGCFLLHSPGDKMFLGVFFFLLLVKTVLGLESI